MKELSIGQKVKACDSNYKVYTELINRLEDVKEAIKKQNYGIAMDVLCKPYPEFQVTTHSELKGSEDEDIKHFLVDFIKVCRWTEKKDQGWPSREKCIAWLEKQSNLMKALQISNARIGELIEKNYYLKEQLEKQGKNNMGISETTKQKLEDNLNKALEKETPESWNEFLEKQGEQKPVEWHIEDEQNLNACLGYIPDEYLRRWLTDVVHVKYDKHANKVESRQEELTEFEKAVKQVMEEAIECGDTHNLKADADMLLRLVQKPWSEEDERKIELLKSLIEDAKGDSTSYSTMFREMEELNNWLKSLKNRVLPQSRQEWSEDDENRINRLIAYFEDKESFTAEDDIVYANWFKSLKDRYTWKPSDEQMDALNDVISSRDIKYDVLSELWKDLKKLKG